MFSDSKMIYDFHIYVPPSKLLPGERSTETNIVLYLFINGISRERCKLGLRSRGFVVIPLTFGLTILNSSPDWQ